MSRVFRSCFFVLAGLCALTLVFSGLANPAFADTPAPVASSAETTVEARPGAAVFSTGSESGASSSSAILEPGIYYIQSTLPGRLMLDVAAASKNDGANVQLYRSNTTAAQRWRVSVDSDGLYTISSECSGKALNALGSQARNGANVVQQSNSGAPLQKWTLAKSGASYTVASAADSTFVLDVASASARDGANVQLYTANGTAAQRWWFIPASPTVSSERTVENGVYELRLSSTPNFALDVAGASKNDGANVRLYSANNTFAQRWMVKWESDGFYSLKNVSSGKALDVTGANPAARTNVHQYASNNTSAQRWALSANTDGSFTLINKASGLALEIAGGKAANGANAQTSAAPRGDFQKFELRKADQMPEGIYSIHPAKASSAKALDVPSASTKEGVQLQIYSSNGTMAQRYQLRRTADGTCTLQNVASGMYLTESSGKVVQQRRKASNAAQRWNATLDGTNVVLTNASTGRRMALASNSTANGTKVVTAPASGDAIQRWDFTATSLFPDGYYTITSAGGKALDIAGASMANGANVQAYQPNSTAAQRFEIKAAGGGLYTIKNDASGKMIDVKGGSKTAGANVHQYAANGTNAQKWGAELSEEGGIVFINKGSGLALDAAGGGKTNGANVRQAAKNGNTGQRWMLSPTTSLGISGNAELDNYLRTIAAQNGYDLRRCYYWVVGNIRWSNSVAGEVLPYGIVSKETTIRHALYAFRYHGGDCYYYAAAFKWLAIACGESAQVRAGSVPSASSGITAHGWTEVYRNGITYICDANLQVDIGGYNWYMVTYATAPNDYYF